MTPAAETVLGRSLSEGVPLSVARLFIGWPFAWPADPEGPRTVLARRGNGMLQPLQVTCILQKDNLTLARLHDLTDLHVLQQNLVSISDRERERLGRDLHDGVGQKLTGIGMLVHALEAELERAGHLEAASRTAAILSHVQDAIRETRTMARQLFPVEVTRQGLLPALRDLADNMSYPGCRVQLELERAPIIESPLIASHVYRIAQEALNNAIRHACASAVTMGLYDEGQSIDLTVSNNGQSIPEQLGDGLGLCIMRSRASLLGGHLVIQKNPGGGTSVRLRFPKGVVLPEPPASSLLR
ncbi:MAG: sensor histidine kinase, partial [Candidatus Xenobia bacterium]